MTAEYIYAHDYTYDFLVCFYLPEIFDPFFREDHATEIEEDERLAYSRYIAALLPYDPNYSETIKNLRSCTEVYKHKKHKEVLP